MRRQIQNEWEQRDVFKSLRNLCQRLQKKIVDKTKVLLASNTLLKKFFTHVKAGEP